MPLYFLLNDAARFHNALRPALSLAWRQRSFEPCRLLCETLLPDVREFQRQYHASTEEPLLAKVARGFPFDRRAWRLLVGEVLLYAAAEIPEIPTAPRTLLCLVAREQLSDQSMDRAQFAPIQQAHFGAHDLTFGTTVYQPERTGYNDIADIDRLADYLLTVDTNRWSEADLIPMNELTSAEERQEELEMSREWFAELRDLYVRQRGRQQVMVCDATAIPG